MAGQISSDSSNVVELIEVRRGISDVRASKHDESASILILCPSQTVVHVLSRTRLLRCIMRVQFD